MKNDFTSNKNYSRHLCHVIRKVISYVHHYLALEMSESSYFHIITILFNLFFDIRNEIFCHDLI